MTTPQAAAGYLAEYRRQMGDRKVVVHNPHSKPVEELPTIFGFNNGGSIGWLQGVLMAQDGTEFPVTYAQTKGICGAIWQSSKVIVKIVTRHSVNITLTGTRWNSCLIKTYEGTRS